MFHLKLDLWRLGGLCLLVIPAVSGCDGGSAKKYVPQSMSARTAIETALKSWQSGGAYDTIKTDTPSVQPYDARWQSGQKLKSFEIVREVSNDGPKKFEVRIELEGAEPVNDVYLVVGIDPLNVFREQDYQKASGVGGESP
jgi:hypothetical protein